jgi:hypothetical protein
LLAQRTFLRLPGSDLKRSERDARDTQVGRTAATVDDRTGASHFGTCRACEVDHFARASAGSDHVLYDDDALSRFERKSTAHRHLAGVALGEDESCAQRARDFVTDDQTADCRATSRYRQNPIVWPDRAELFGDRGVLEHQRALQVFVGMEAAGQTEMTF